MEKLVLESTKQSPEIQLDVENSNFSIKGVSMPEDAVGFYEPIFEWLKKYAENPISDAKFELELSYFNTASAKMIIEFCKQVSEISSNKIIWTYEDDDEDLEEIGEDLKELIGDSFVANPVPAE